MRRRGSSRSLSTLTTTFQFVETFIIGPGNSPFRATTFQIFQRETKRTTKRCEEREQKSGEKSARDGWFRSRPVASRREERRSCKPRPSRRTRTGRQLTRHGTGARTRLRTVAMEAYFFPELDRIWEEKRSLSAREGGVRSGFMRDGSREGRRVSVSAVEAERIQLGVFQLLCNYFWWNLIVLRNVFI